MSNPPPDIFLEQDSTRVVGPLDIATRDTPGTERITVDPTDASIRVHSAPDGTGGQVAALEGDQLTPDTVVELGSQFGDHGRLRLRDDSGSNDVVVTADARQSGALEVRDQSFGAGVHLSSVFEGEQQDGGVISVEEAQGVSSVLVRPERVSDESVAGQVELRAASPGTGVRLGGQDAVLELTGGFDGGGGGNLLLREWPKDDDVDGDPVPNDINVHATADDSPAYGRSAGNPPLILLDGPEATVELGRRALDDVRDGMNGRFKLRYDMGQEKNTLFEGGVRTSSSTSADRHSELVFRKDNQGSLERGGAIGTDPDGLVFYSGGQSRDAALRVRKDGTVETDDPVDDEALPKVGPQSDKDDFVVSRGNTAEIPFIVGDHDAMVWGIGDETEDGYEIGGKIKQDGGTDVRLTLLFDTVLAGDLDDGTPTVSLEGDWTLTVIDETSLTGELSKGDYEIVLWGRYDTFTGTLFVE